MERKKNAFTLIELIIVVVIIGILALIAIPKYYANVAKAQKTQAYATMSVIVKSISSYYTVYGKYPADCIFPVTVTVDGDVVVNLTSQDNPTWHFCYRDIGGGEYAIAYKAPTYDTTGCYCQLYVNSTSVCSGICQ